MQLFIPNHLCPVIIHKITKPATHLSVLSIKYYLLMLHEKKVGNCSKY